MKKTRTVELPLTKTEQRHADNIRRRDKKRERAAGRAADKRARDEALIAVNDEYGPKIAKLRAEAADKRKKIWDKWRKKRDAS